MAPRASRLVQPTDVALREIDENEVPMSPGVKRKYPPADVQCTPQRPPAAKRSAAVVTTTAASATPINGAAVQDEWLEICRAEGLTIEQLLEVRVTGKKFDHKEKLNQAMPLLKKMRACIRHLHAETTTAAEQRQSLIATHKGELMEWETKATALQRMCDRAEEDLVRKQKDLNEAAEALSALETQVAELQGKAAQQAQLVEEKEREMRDREGELRRAMAEAEDLRGQLERAREAAAAEEAGLREQLAEAKETAAVDAAKLREQLAEAKETAAGAQAMARGAQEHARAVEEREARAQGRVAELLEEWGGLQGELAGARARVASLGEEVAAAGARASEADKARAAAAEEADKMRRRVGELESKLSAQRESAAGQKARMEEELGRVQELVKELKGSLTESRDNNAELTRQCKRLTEALEAAEVAATTARREKEEAVAKVTGEKEALASQVADLEEKGKAMGAAVQKAKAEAQALDAQRHEAATQRDSLQSHLSTAQAELQRWQGMYKEIEQQLEELRRKRSELQSTSGDQAMMIENLKQEVEALTKQNHMNRQQAVKHEEDHQSAVARAAGLEAQLDVMRKNLQQAEVLRRKMHNTIQDLKGSIRVYCRVRPIKVASAGDAEGGEESALGFFEDVERKDTAVALSYVRNEREQKHCFEFDKVFRPDSTQEQVFEEISQLVQSALDGYRVCIFAYGQTGSGKTHTMMGTPENPGTIPRAMEQVFRQSKELEMQGWEYTMRVSMIEIYNEEYRDLLSRKPRAAQAKIEVQHDDIEKETILTNCTVLAVSDAEEVQELIERAMAARSVAATAMNAQSSRSHSVFVLWIEGRNRELGQQFKSSLNMVDLAGSERLKDSLAEGDRKEETVNINKSLSAVKTCFNEMVNRSKGGRAHVNYRSSKLTWLLKPALEGEAKTLMFVNCSPAVRSASETKSSMEFAAKVNSTVVGRAASSKTALDDKSGGPSAKRPASARPAGRTPAAKPKVAWG